VRWGGSALGILYVSTLIDVANVRTAFARVSIEVIAASIAILAIGIVLGAVRWRVTLRAYGARARPPLLTAVRLYYVAVFYNTFLPGAVAGDVVRGVVTRDSFGEHGATGALAVVFVERALCLFAVFALVLTGFALFGGAAADHSSLRSWSLIGGAGSLAAVMALPLGRRLARFLPGPLARIARQLPSVTRPLDFASATLLSLSTQLAVVITGWLILRDLHPRVTFADALLVVPAAAATSFLPITVGGTGAREAVFVALGGELLGMSIDDAVAASLLLWLATLIVGAIGGVLVAIGDRAAAIAGSRESPARPCPDRDRTSRNTAAGSGRASRTRASDEAR
jgi:uncharacterized membrane protein YbhN (UPF0104 family)